MAEAAAQTGEAAPPLLRVRGLARYFDASPPLLNRLLSGGGRRVLKAVDGVSFDIARGRTLGLVGESGSGKSTVARCVVGLYPPSAGTIAFAGHDIAGVRAVNEIATLRRRVQIIFQDPYGSLNPRWRVSDIIAEPLRIHRLLRGRAALTARVDELLLQVGLATGDADKFPHEFSGGQRQRISIARALASAPDFLVCDEPTSALDVSVQAQILNLMKALQRRLGLTYLFISHNLAVVRHMADAVGVMYLGRLAELAEARVLFERPGHPYTRLLLATIPDLTLSGRARAPVAGEVASPIDPPTGCGFHPRCPYADARCRRERPELHPAAGGGLVACHAVAEGRLPS